MATLKLPGTIPVVKEALNIVYRKKKRHFRSFCNFVGILKGGMGTLRVDITSSISVNITGRR